MTHTYSYDRQGAFGLAPSSPARDELKLHYPFASGSRNEKAVLQLQQVMTKYIQAVKHAMRMEPDLKAHLDILDRAETSLLNLKAQLEQAANALYY